MSEIKKVKFRLSRILFPKDKRMVAGEYAILSCILTENISKSEISLHPTYCTFSLTGTFPKVINAYDEYSVVMEEYSNQYGISYKFLNFLEENPKELTDGDKRAFLENILTPTQVDRLYSKYPNPYDLIAKKQTSMLTEVRGIGYNTVERLYKKYEENLKYSELIIELREYGLSRLMMDKLLAKYKTSQKVIEVIKDNPYLLAQDIDGIGFLKADAIALNGGISKSSPNRLKAFILYYLQVSAEEGNSWVKPKILFGDIEQNLGIKFDDETIRKVLYELQEEKKVNWNEEHTRIYAQRYYDLEYKIYEELNRLKNGENKFNLSKETKDKIISQIAQEDGFELTDEQREAVDLIMSNNVSILTAGAGSGKSYLIKVLSTLFIENKLSFCLCSLSGKASARIQEATGFEGATIHRTLKYQPNGTFFFNAENKLGYDVIIVDETSFVGGELFYSLIQAIKNNAKLILVGDDKQLPSIGMCNIFYDLIHSNKIPLARLTKIHRQAQKSGIIIASKNIREGKQITQSNWTGIETRGELQDFTIDIYDNPMYGNAKIMEWYKHFVKSLDDVYHTQIITAMKFRGNFNTHDLNVLIQNAFNPASPNKKEIQVNKDSKIYIIREGDKVINRKNNYNAEIYRPNNFKDNTYIKEFTEVDDFGHEVKNQDTAEIFNGFCGKVEKIVDKKIIVKFDLCKERIVFNYGDRFNLELAYALTTHLFQGSQIENVIFAIDNGSYIMNNKELVYTGITRASKQCILLAEQSSLRSAINTSATNKKQTFLKDFIQNENA